MNRAMTPVIVLATSKAWQAAIERAFPARMLIWALDENDLLTEADQYQDSAIIVEFSGAAWLTDKGLAVILDQRRRVFVVAALGRSVQAERLRAIGVADVVVTIAQTRRLHSLIQRHNMLVPEQNIPLETQIESALPWRRQAGGN